MYRGLDSSSLFAMGNPVMPVPMLTLAAILILLAGLVALRLRRLERAQTDGFVLRQARG